MATVLHRLAAWAKETPNATAQRYKSGGQWKAISAQEFSDRVYHLALFLESKGIDASKCGAILSYNCPEWVHFDLAVLLTGAKSAGLYPNSTTKDIHYILNHTEAAVLGVQNKEYFKKITGENGDQTLPERIKLIIVFDGETSFAPSAVSYASAIEEGGRLARSGKAKPLQAYLDRLKPRDGAFMIYTSGTTGNPKGALLSHDNLVFASDVVSDYWKLPFGRGSMFSFLPLCHIAEKLQNVGVGISRRYLVNFCSKFENVSTELPEAQPTLLLCVPRLWEKMMEGVINKVSRGKGAKKKLAIWALGVGERVGAAKFAGRRPSPLDALQLPLAEKLVLSKVKHALGLAKAELLASGAAALPAHVSRWFWSLGLEILEDFGQTESAGIICMTAPGVDMTGTVGKPIPGLEFKIAEDGEILTRGRHVFVGYFKDDVATAATLHDGWLATGDLGEVDSRGFVKIRGRKKEILKTSGGKMIAPLPIEERLKESPLIGQVCMVGDGRKFLSALITLSEAALADLKERNPQATDNGVLRDPATLAEVKKYIDTLNRSLAQFEQIKRFTVISRDFSIADGEMTPTLKMKRNVIESRFKDVIDSMYSGASEA